MDTPGASSSTQAPPSEKEAMLSLESVAATAMTEGCRAGLSSQASAQHTYTDEQC